LGLTITNSGPSGFQSARNRFGDHGEAKYWVST
jgi:hypothetical protein